MAVTKGTTTTPTTAEEHEVLTRARGFWDKYSKPIMYIGGAIILIIAGWYGYVNFIKLPNEKKADEAIYAAEAIFDKMSTAGFSKDSVNIALNGGALEGKKITGLLKVVSNYGGTKSGNRARYMVGASYLQIKEFDKAIKYLKEYEADGAEQVQSLAYKMIGDAYSEQKKTEDALNYYKKAAEVSGKDEAFTGNALAMAADYASYIGKTKDAIELYTKLRDKYPDNGSVKSGEVDKQLAKLGLIDNN